MNNQNVGNTFPLDTLPNTLAEKVEELSNEFYTDILVPSMFVATSTAMGNAFNVKIKENQQYSALKSNLWYSAIALPNTGKTQSLKWAFNPLMAMDNVSYENAKEVAKETGERQIDYFHYITNDSTIESFRRLNETNGRGVCLYKPELSGWWKNFKKSGGDDTDFFISTWDGISAAIDRATTGSYRWNDPFLSVTGTTQPVYIEELMSDKRSENGFMDRILFSYPKDLMKREELTLTPPDTGASKYWSNFITDVTKLNQNDPVTYTLSDSAYEVYSSFYTENARETNELLKKRSSMANAIGKYDIQVLKIGLILQIMFNELSNDQSLIASNNRLTKGVMERAVNVARWFKGELKKVYTVEDDKPAAYKRSNEKTKKWLDKIGYDGVNRATCIGLAEECGVNKETRNKALANKNLFLKQYDHDAKEDLYYRVY